MAERQVHMRTVKIYADIVLHDVEKIKYERVDYQDVDWARVFPGHGWTSAKTIQDICAYDKTLADSIKKMHADDGYYESKDLKGKYELEKKQTLVTNKYPITFDIETNPDGTSWVQQICINGTTIVCHGWDETMDVFRRIEEEMMGVAADNTYSVRAVATILIANLGFEFQFIRQRLNFTDVFATGARAPLTAQTDYIYFRDPLRLSNSSLSKLSDLYDLPTKKAYKIVDGKKIMDLDYSIPRTTKWICSDDEWEYICNDVEILADFWRWCIENYVCNNYKIPQTATGICRDTVAQFARHELQTTTTKVNKKGKTVTKTNPTKLGKLIPKLFPDTLAEYDDLMLMTFAGGYTKSNMYYTGKELTNVNGCDFTSSYPSVMINDKFPMEEFRKIDPSGVTIQRILDIADETATIAKIRFYDVKPLTSHSVQSISKTYEYQECGKRASTTMKKYNMVCDNGRVFAADQMTVSCTELDLQTFSEFYEWKNYEILSIQMADKDYLPDYIRYSVALYYQLKADLKRAGLDETTEYRIAKASVNSMYGMMCEKIHIEQDICICDEQSADCWTMTELKCNREHAYKCQIYGVAGDFNDPKEIGKQQNKINAIEQGRMLTGKFLSPYWAVYVTAHARRNLLRNVYEMDKDCKTIDDEIVIYCDTDSIYFKDCKRARRIIAEWNNRIHKRNKKVISAWNSRHNFDRKKYDSLPADDAKDYLDNTMGMLEENFMDLGEFDILNTVGNYTRFKTLGCKRYLKTGPHKNKKTGEIEVETVATIAGLPKTALNEYAAQHGMDPYDVFQPGMVIPDCKKTHTYVDEPYTTTITDSQGNTEEMSEMSSIIISSIDFSMKLDHYYSIIMEYVEDEMRYSNTELLDAVDALKARFAEDLEDED